MADAAQATTTTTALTPAPVTPTTVAAPSTSFWDYLKNNIPNHLILLGTIAALIGGVLLFNYVRDMRDRLANQEKVTATLSQSYQQVGTAAVAKNTEQTQPLVLQQASDAFGPAVIQLMAQQNDKIQSLTTAVAQANAQVSALQTQLPALAPHQDSSTGALTGYPMEESRQGLPPLTSVNLYYDPKQHDPTLAFKGTTWQHYQEKFTTTLGDWEQQKTGGYRTTVKLTRTVSKPDPNDPTKLIAVGTEDVAVTGANTIYTPTSILGSNPFVLPRWTFNLGVSKDTVNGYQPAGTVDYRVTNRYGVFGGTVNKALVGGVSIRLGNQ